MSENSAGGCIGVSSKARISGKTTRDIHFDKSFPAAYQVELRCFAQDLRFIPHRSPYAIKRGAAG
jgi:hypothetical protein